MLYVKSPWDYTDLGYFHTLNFTTPSFDIVVRPNRMFVNWPPPWGPEPMFNPCILNTVKRQNFKVLANVTVGLIDWKTILLLFEDRREHLKKQLRHNSMTILLWFQTTLIKSKCLHLERNSLFQRDHQHMFYSRR